MQTQDTIVAIASGAGKAGIGIVRLSGPDAFNIARAVAGTLPEPRQAQLRWLRDADGARLDRGLVICFVAPRSLTGEDVVELQGHGGPVILDLVRSSCIAAGARAARPGEFSERAFLNDKMDLAQAEGIADLINSQTERAARAALRSMRGDFSAAVHALVEQLIRLRMYVEAAIDFPEEEIDFLDDAGLQHQIDAVITAFDNLQAKTRAGRALADGLNVVLMGAPNVGKSSIMNALSGDATAIVTDIPGTTRDLIREPIDLDGVPVQLTDTAGLRDATDVIEREGIKRSQQALQNADHALLLVQADDDDAAASASALIEKVPHGATMTVIVNKTDLTDAAKTNALLAQIPAHSLCVSALTGDGIDELRQRLMAVAGIVDGETEGSFSARRRHVGLLQQARAHVDAGIHQLRQHKAGELLAEELRLAQQPLTQITGTFSSDDLLGRIFGEFCIGK
ncbi:MAG: tRNA uridine-5-carboxymethylaminomethyl(34) synthesis GTPase MnmE [Pseudomonadota bacterium]